MMETIRLVTFFVLAVCFGVEGFATDWPQWRGANRDGTAAALPRRGEWPDQLARGWRARVGAGHSSPVVKGGRVFQHSREGDAEQVSAFDLASGERLWLATYPAPYEMNPAARPHGKGPKSTPVVALGRLHTLGIDGILSCFDAANGELIWRREPGDEFAKTSPLYGVASSPVVDDGRLMVHLGGPGEGALFALDAATGTEFWTWRGDGPGYASPVVAEVAGVRQVITQTEQLIVGLALEDGRLLWKLPFTTPYVQNIVTPVVRGDVLIYSGLDNGVSAVRLVRDDNEWRITPLWKQDDVSLYMSSPILLDGTLYGLSHKRRGQYFALDATNGKITWTSEGRQAENAALVGSADAMLFLTDAAELLVVLPGRERFTLVATYTVAESATWAHPVVVKDGVLIKDADSLTLWQIP